MRRVVVTGIGIVSSIGNNTEEVYNSLIPVSYTHLRAHET